MKVQDIMHRGAICVEPTTPLTDIAKHMRDGDIGAVPVRDNGKLVGIITDRDITCRTFLADGDDVSMKIAADVMTKDVVCCSADDDIEAVIDVMETQKIRRLPVTDGQNALVGMLSLGDISHKVGKNRSGELLRSVSAHHT